MRSRQLNMTFMAIFSDIDIKNIKDILDPLFVCGLVLCRLGAACHENRMCVLSCRLHCLLT